MKDRAGSLWTAFWRRWGVIVGVFLMTLAGVAVGMGVQAYFTNTTIARMERVHAVEYRHVTNAYADNVKLYANRVSYLTTRLDNLSTQTYKASNTAAKAASTAKQAATAVGVTNDKIRQGQRR